VESFSSWYHLTGWYDPARKSTSVKWNFLKRLESFNTVDSFNIVELFSMKVYIYSKVGSFCSMEHPVEGMEVSSQKAYVSRVLSFSTVEYFSRLVLLDMLESFRKKEYISRVESYRIMESFSRVNLFNGMESFYL
jgi:hypothetical protein